MSTSEPEGGFGVVLFHSVQGALGAEKLLLAAGVAHKLITVPRHLSSDCGFCLRFAWGDRERVERLLGTAKLGVERIEAL
ncbi:MAG: DUF3343 domain-containing protein [Deltaproteobacteria bacterium]|nr:DUF3343 domain-containing protein [Deltaproteobacteria bacterium]